MGVAVGSRRTALVKAVTPYGSFCERQWVFYPMIDVRYFGKEMPPYS